MRVVDAASGEAIPGASVYAAPMEEDLASDLFPGFTYRAGSAGTADAQGEIVLRALVPAAHHELRARAAGYERGKLEQVTPANAGVDPAEVTIALHRRP